MSSIATTKNLFCRVKSTTKFTSKFKSKPWVHFKSDTQQYSSAGWCIGVGVPKNLFNPYLKAPNSFKSFVQFNQQYVRGFRNSKSVIGKGNNSPKSRFGLPPVKDTGQTMSDRFSPIYKPLGFTAFVAASSFIGCTIWKYEQYRSTLSRDRWFSPGVWRIPDLEPGLPQTVTTLGDLTIKVGSLRAKINSWWSQIPDGEKLFWVICGINTAVFAAWRVGPLATTMVTYFSASPSSRAVCWPMLLSTFSHYSLYHLAINMFVLHSFMPAAVNVLGKEQFLSLYLTTGVVSSFGSHLQKLMMNVNIPSLGASGAIMGILGLVCTKFPEIQLGIIFVPGFSFSADTALKCMIAVDSVGILAGWKFIDHAAHLSGTLFGIAFSNYGHLLNPTRDLVMEVWHDFRNRLSS